MVIDDGGSEVGCRCPGRNDAERTDRGCDSVRAETAFCCCAVRGKSRIVCGLVVAAAIASNPKVAANRRIFAATVIVTPYCTRSLIL